jgi:hypothetical protein
MTLVQIVATTFDRTVVEMTLDCIVATITLEHTGDFDIIVETMTLNHSFCNDLGPHSCNNDLGTH